MAEQTKPDFRNVWASGGAVVAPSTTKQQTGWVAEVPPYQWENWAQNRQDQMLVHINQHGIPMWDALTEYFASKSYCMGSDGVIYKAVSNSSPSTVAQNPTTDTANTYWMVAFAGAGSFLTQSQGDARFMQRSLNGSDVGSASTFRTNIGVVQATETVAGLAEIATQSEVNTGTDNVRIVTPSKLASWFTDAARQATQTVLGVIKIATQTQVNAGTDDTTAVTPQKLRSGFNFSAGVNGYISFPTWMGGFIFQWGRVVANVASVNQTSVVNWAYPTGFPNQCFNAWAFQHQLGGNSGASLLERLCGGGEPSTTAVTFNANDADTAGNYILRVYAIGY